MLFANYESDGLTPIFFQTAQENEAVFRGVLQHIKENSPHITGELDPQLPLEDLLTSVHPKDAYGRLAVYDFLHGPRENSSAGIFCGKIATDEAVLSFGSFATLSGAGAINKYAVEDDLSVRFKTTVLSARS